ELAEFNLGVFSEVQAQSAVLSQCDNSIDGDDTNGFVEFDLFSADTDVLGGLSPSEYTVSYHRNQADADNGVNAIVTSFTNVVVSADQVIARVENNGNSDCYDTAVVSLVVEALPTLDASVVELRQCDDDTDGLSDFNLTEAEELISSNYQNETFSYHQTQADAQSGSNAITNPLIYSNIDPSSNADRLYVRVMSSGGCYRVAALDLVVSTTQIPIGFELLYEVCDGYDVDNDNTNGIETFDFSDATALIEAEYPAGQNITVSYYQNIEDALSETDAIVDISNYRNESSAFEQRIVVRVDSDVDNSCLGLGEHIVLRTVNPQPNRDPQDLILCDDITPGDLTELFDLTQNEFYILNSEADVVASYHTSIADAEAGTGAISTPSAYPNTSPTQTIYVRVTNSVTGCYARVEFDIQVNPLPSTVPVEDLLACEDNTDGIFDFDLESKTLEVLGGQDPSLYQVTYHQTQADADALNNGLSSPYANTSNPQPIYVAITNVQTGCSVSTQGFNLVVQEAAIFNPGGVPVVYEVCDTVNANDGFAQFDLSTQSATILDDQDPVDFSISYHASMEDAMNNVTPLPLLYENLENPQTIYARVSNKIAPEECFDIGPVVLQVNGLPETVLEEVYVLCTTTNGTEVVETPPVIDTGLSGIDYSFEWYYNGVLLDTELGSSIIATASGDYEVLITDLTTSVQTNCSNSFSTVVIDSDLPELTAEVTTAAFSNAHVIEAMATGIGVYEYSLDNGSWQTEGVFEDVTIGLHTITARDRNGCGLVRVEVMVMDYPRYFTPNGDGSNELWQISGIENQPNAKIYIFDRYGKLLVQLSPTGQGWDGTYNGNLMPSDDYWFSVNYTEPITGDPKIFKAHFTLKR
ncbi:MAG: T9SS type B sorting domain-containing protein, partial [Rhodobacteraceae bacterium]|nr:T9SS type B sorting domain-containing protein [Paracoccaceae bacterium]